MLIELSEENKKIIGQLETAVEKLNVYLGFLVAGV